MTWDDFLIMIHPVRVFLGEQGAAGVIEPTTSAKDKTATYDRIFFHPQVAARCRENSGSKQVRVVKRAKHLILQADGPGLHIICTDHRSSYKFRLKQEPRLHGVN